MEDHKQGVADLNRLGFNGEALSAEIGNVGKKKELLSLDSASVVDKLVEECGFYKAGNLFKVGCYFSNYAVILEATERSNNMYEE